MLGFGYKDEFIGVMSGTKGNQTNDVEQENNDTVSLKALLSKSQNTLKACNIKMNNYMEIGHNLNFIKTTIFEASDYIEFIILNPHHPQYASSDIDTKSLYGTIIGLSYLRYISFELTLRNVSSAVKVSRTSWNTWLWARGRPADWGLAGALHRRPASKMRVIASL